MHHHHHQHQYDTHTASSMCGVQQRTMKENEKVTAADTPNGIWRATKWQNKWFTTQQSIYVHINMAVEWEGLTVLCAHSQFLKSIVTIDNVADKRAAEQWKQPKCWAHERKTKNWMQFTWQPANMTTMKENKLVLVSIFWENSFICYSSSSSALLFVWIATKIISVLTYARLDGERTKKN